MKLEDVHLQVLAALAGGTRLKIFDLQRSINAPVQELGGVLDALAIDDLVARNEQLGVPYYVITEAGQKKLKASGFEPAPPLTPPDETPAAPLPVEEAPRPSRAAAAARPVDPNEPESEAPMATHAPRGKVRDDILKKLAKEQLRNGELAKALGLAEGLISYHVRALEEAGRIERDNRLSPWRIAGGGSSVDRFIKAKRKTAKPAKKAREPSGPLTVTKALEQLESCFARKVERLDVKVKVLTAIKAKVDPILGAVLDEIVADLQPAR